MPLPKFKNEAEFREKWIGPFLQKLGYVLVTHTHGAGEQGKDFIFADFDRFEHIRYYAVQAKVGSIRAGNIELDNLLNQVKRCFSVRIQGYKGADEQRVSSVYILASGKISDEARRYITGYCHSEHYGENVYYLDGDRLDHLKRFATYRDEHQRRAMLVGLYFEAQTNVTLLPSFKEIIAKKELTGDRCRCSAMDQALTYPPDNRELFACIDQTYTSTHNLNHTFEALTLAALTRATLGDEARDNIITHMDTVLEQNIELRDLAKKAIDDLNAKYKIDIEILSDEGEI